MILLADGGSTKVDWRLVDDDKEIKRILTKGANPFLRTREDIGEELKTVLKPALNGYRIDAVYFFGAGCVSADKSRPLVEAIADNVNTPHIEIDSDLLAAARGLCGTSEGLACILGTGSNSCFYDGKEIREHIPSLGYVLGDEGSGAALGKLFLGACLKGLLSEGIKERFLDEYDLTPETILETVYRKPMANRFLASVSMFIAKNLHDKTIYDLVRRAFREFFIRNVMQYDYKNYEAHFTGSVAYHYEELLRKTGTELGVKTGIVTQSPMEGLIKYYAAKQKKL